MQNKDRGIHFLVVEVRWTSVPLMVDERGSLEQY